MNDSSTVLSKVDIAAPKCEESTETKITMTAQGNLEGEDTSRTVVAGDATNVEATERKGFDEDKTAIADNLPSEDTSNLANDATEPVNGSATAPTEESNESADDNEPEKPNGKRRVGKIVAGAVGGVLLGSAAAYAAIHGFGDDSDGGSAASSKAAANTAADADVAAEAEESGDTVLPNIENVEAKETASTKEDGNVAAEGELDDDILQVMEDDDEEYVEVKSGEEVNNVDETPSLTETNETLAEERDEPTSSESAAEESATNESANEDLATDTPAEGDASEDLSADVDEAVKVSVAHDVTDDMSFNEAFAAARAEVGAGGVFEWRGNVYGTYYADEWNEMSDDEKEAFSQGIDLSADDSEGDMEVVAEDDDMAEILEIDDEDDGDIIEVLGISDDDDADIELALLDDDDNVVFVDVDSFEDDGDVIIDVAEDDIFDDDFNVVESLCDDADDMSWGDDDIFA